MTVYNYIIPEYIILFSRLQGGLLRKRLVANFLAIPRNKAGNHAN